MILPVHERLRTHLARLLSTVYSVEPAALPPIVLEYPPTRELGDLGTPVAFEHLPLGRYDLQLAGTDASGADVGDTARPTGSVILDAAHRSANVSQPR